MKQEGSLSRDGTEILKIKTKYSRCNGLYGCVGKRFDVEVGKCLSCREYTEVDLEDAWAERWGIV